MLYGLYCVHVLLFTDMFLWCIKLMMRGPIPASVALSLWRSSNSNHYVFIFRTSNSLEARQAFKSLSKNIDPQYQYTICHGSGYYTWNYFMMHLV